MSLFSLWHTSVAVESRGQHSTVTHTVHSAVSFSWVWPPSVLIKGSLWGGMCRLTWSQRATHTHSHTHTHTDTVAHFMIGWAHVPGPGTAVSLEPPAKKWCHPLCLDTSHLSPQRGWSTALFCLSLSLSLSLSPSHTHPLIRLRAVAAESIHVRVITPTGVVTSFRLASPRIHSASRLQIQKSHGSGCKLSSSAPQAKGRKKKKKKKKHQTAQAAANKSLRAQWECRGQRSDFAAEGSLVLTGAGTVWAGGNRQHSAAAVRQKH